MEYESYSINTVKDTKRELSNCIYKGSLDAKEKKILNGL